MAKTPSSVRNALKNSRFPFLGGELLGEPIGLLPEQRDRRPGLPPELSFERGGQRLCFRQSAVIRFDPLFERGEIFVLELSGKLGAQGAVRIGFVELTGELPRRFLRPRSR